MNDAGDSDRSGRQSPARVDGGEHAGSSAVTPRAAVELDAGRTFASAPDPIVFPMWCEQAREYAVVISEGLPDPRSVLPATTSGVRKVLAVTTPTVDRLHGAAFRRWIEDSGTDAVVEVIALDEERKSMEAVLQLGAFAQRLDLGRRDVMIAFGGGVCSDVVSVAASLTRRGIAHITVPTTLVGQVDAGIGLKGGVNFGGKKNYLGCFSPPERALIDPTYLRTLPPRELRCGLAEIMKMALVRDRELFDALRLHGAELIDTAFASPPHVARYAIARSIQLMLDELEPNSFEDKTLQRLVDFGHTFSSTLEERSSYGLRHGEAVAVDMALSCEVGARLGILDRSECEEILDVFGVLGLPVFSRHFDGDAAARAVEVTMAHRGGSLNLVVPETIGRGTFIVSADEVPAGVVAAAVDALRSRGAAGSDLYLPRGA
jgi:3-dehydroquinate synthetase